MSERQHIARDIGADLGQAENAMDAAYAAVTGLCSRLPAYQTEIRLSPVASQRALGAFTRAAAKLAEARAELVDGHNHLETLRRAMGLEPVTASGPYDKPNQPSVVTEMEHAGRAAAAA